MVVDEMIANIRDAIKNMETSPSKVYASEDIFLAHKIYNIFNNTEVFLEPYLPNNTAIVLNSKDQIIGFLNPTGYREFIEPLDTKFKMNFNVSFEERVDETPYSMLFKSTAYRQ